LTFAKKIALGARILVLEDHDALAELMRRRLEAAGHSVRVFAHAVPALDEIDGGASFDVYLLDVRMPPGELHGLAFARMIIDRIPDARIIFTTVEPALVAGRDKNLGPVFAKPIDFIKLLKEIESPSAAGS
jgi:CheY-like chemotaxis protein